MISENDLGLRENLTRLKSKLRRHAAAMEALKKNGLRPATIERLHLGLKEPYRHRADQVEVRDALCYPVVDRAMRPIGRYAYMNLEGVTENPHRGDTWGPGPSVLYALGAEFDGAIGLVGASVADCWLAWQAAAGQHPEIAFVSRSHADGWPAEWRSAEQWGRFAKIIVLPGTGQTEALELIASHADQVVNRLHLPPGVNSIAELPAAEFSEWLDSATGWLPEVPCASAAISPDQLGIFEATAMSVVGAFHEGHSYYPFAVEQREYASASHGRSGNVVQRYSTMVLRSDGQLLTTRQLPAPKGTPCSQRIVTLSDGTRILDEPQVAMSATWSFSSISRYIEWRRESGVQPYRGLKFLLADVESYVRDRIWLPEEGHYLTVALYVVLSHVFRVFEAIPLLAIAGETGSGKSELADAIARLSFNSVVAGQLRAACMIRLIGETRGLLVLDDEDGRRASSSSDLVQALKSSYKRFTARKPVADRGGRVKVIDFFGPKVLSSGVDVDASLGARMIVVRSERLQGGRQLIRNRWWLDTDLDALRDELHCWGLAEAPRLAAIYRSGRPPVDQRSEILAPLFAILDLADDDALAVRFSHVVANPRTWPENNAVSETTH